MADVFAVNPRWHDWVKDADTALAELPVPGKPVVYWMVREHRVQENRGLWLAQQMALAARAPLLVVCAFRTDLRKALMARRTFAFLLDGLREVEGSLAKHQIPFYFLQGDVVDSLVQFIKQYAAGVVVTDLYPLPVYERWQAQVRDSAQVPLVVVDSHNIVPVWKASIKREYAARTIRPKIHSQLTNYLHENLELCPHPYSLQIGLKTDWVRVLQSTKTIEGFPPLQLVAGTKAALQRVGALAQAKLAGYAQYRNDPTLDNTSRLSGYLHFGHISSAMVLGRLSMATVRQADSDVLVEEMVVRKELSDNFCYFRHSDVWSENLPQWALSTLRKHESDERTYTYSFDELLTGRTHDAAWNAAAKQLLLTGFMHGYMRMYWAKKILEWSVNVSEAIDKAVYINDLLELDGRDPNGYVGILWSVGGLHDRPWGERAIYGMVRSMSLEGLKRKFDLNTYLSRWNSSEVEKAFE